MSRWELTIVDTMSEMGGHFDRGLASLYCVADHENRLLIRQTWPDEWAKYEGIATARLEEERV